MKRFGVWTLVVAIAIMVLGYVRPGFTQPAPAPPGSVCLEHPSRPLIIARKPCSPDEGPAGTSIYLGSCCTDVCDALDIGQPQCPSFAPRSSSPETQGCQYWAHENFGYIPLAACPPPPSGSSSRISADDFASSTALSGASGRSKKSSIGAGKESGEPNHAGNDGGASVWWTWTAPATGSVTFDTRGSNFDTLLAIYTGTSLNRLPEIASNDDASDGTLQSEVRFRAQQGQTYHIAVDGYGGKSGTVVLNWQAVSSGSGNSRSDDFRLRTSISRASGRSGGSNVGAGIESGEPNHAGNSGGASVWWTWTAPTTGSFTFDTRGSDFDTLLAVYTGDSLNRLTAVASNDDDAEGGLLQSAVRFSAQQGQTYHIAVDGYGGATGAIVLNWRSASVESGPTNPLREQVFDNPAPGQPAYVITGDNASLQYWTGPAGTVSQTLYENADGTERVRIFYDDATGAPQTVLNEVSGHWLSIREAGSNRVDFWAYDGGGSYLGGFAVYEMSGEYYTGEIVGVPAHEWNQITGQLNPTGASWTGDFTLTGDVEDGLVNVQLLPPEFTTLVDLLAPTGLTGTSTTNGGYQPIVAGHNKAHTFRTIGGYAFLGGLLLVTSPVTATIGTVLGVGGLALVAGSIMYDAIGEGLRNSMHNACPGSDAVASSCREIRGMAADFLTDPAGGLVGRVQDMVDWVKERPARLADRVSRGLQSITDIDDELPSGYQLGTMNNSMPASLIGPPTVPGSLSGTASGPTSGATQVTGTINTSGNFNVSGSNVTISGSYSNGAVSGGTFRHGTTSGTIAQPGGTSQLSAFIPSDAEASAFFPSETSYVRENCSPRSCTDLYYCYRCSDLYYSYRCSDLYYSYRCSDLYYSYSCSGSGPAYDACNNERSKNYNACKAQRTDYYDSCKSERSDNDALCKNQRTTNYNACKASE